MTLLRFCLLTAFAAASCRAATNAPVAVTVTVALYHPDPGHVWNRVHAALWVRTLGDGVTYDDLLDPPLWPNSRHLLSGELNRKAVAVLREFADDAPAMKRMSPTQRALMQRDLLGVFHWLVGQNQRQDARWTPEQYRLAEGLARAIRHVALTREQIRRLPDNYRAAAALPGATTAFDALHPQRLFLPRDLLDEDGPWIALEPQGDDWLAATVHFKAFRGRSAFEVRMRHPRGREPGEAYLKQLAAMPSPFVYQKPAGIDRLMPHVDTEQGPWVNPKTPQFPTNTIWALVRRAVLADPGGNPVVSPLVESVQIRVYRGFGEDARENQTFFEWQLSRPLLLGHGGFHPLEAGDQRFAHFMTHGVDPFEVPGSVAPSNRGGLDCYACHSAPGIHSVLSRSRLFEPKLSRPPTFGSVTSARVAQITEIEATALPAWALLRWMAAPQPP